MVKSNRKGAGISTIEYGEISQGTGASSAAVNDSTFPTTGTLPTLCIEQPLDRRIFGITAVIIILAYSLALHFYWSPAHPGTDQNGYLVGGKLLAQTFTSGFKPADPFLFVGRMWVKVDDGRYFPKYPVGLSLLYAITLKIGGTRLGLFLTFLVSPVAMALALLASFLLIRLIAGSFAACLSLLILISSAVTLGLTNNPNSHATALCLVTWGIYLLLRWWQRNGLARAILAGFLLGAAVTIRYTEGLLLLPLLLVLALNFRRREVRSRIESASLLAAWFLPVLLLIAYNWFSFHHITGYDPTNESTGFSWANFQNNWDVMVHQIYNNGLFFIIPFSVFGFVMMWRWNIRIALFLALWIVPNLAIYSAYYWAPDGTSIAYLRFFLTIFPALALLAAWTLRKITQLLAAEGAPITSAIALFAVLCIATGVSLASALPDVESDAQVNVTLYHAGKTITQLCPPTSALFAFTPDRVLNYVQLIGDYQLYDGQQFSRQGIQQLANIDPNQPNGLQPQRAKEMYDRKSNATDAELIHDQNILMDEALARGHRVFFIFARNAKPPMRFLPKRLYTITTIGSWFEPAPKLPRRPTPFPINPRIRMRIEPSDTTYDIAEVKAVPRK